MAAEPMIRQVTRNRPRNGCDAIWGESTPRSQAEFARLKTLLQEADGGADRVIRTFKHHADRSTGNRRSRIRAELTYFRNQRSRLNSPEYRRQHLPIASGVIEAACKTLVTQRLKCSGMAWSPAGGQAILTFRSLIQSARWPRAWQLLAADFRQPILVMKSAPTKPIHHALEPIAQSRTIPEDSNYHALPLVV